MKKIFATIVATTMLAATLLSGCGNGDGGGAAAPGGGEGNTSADTIKIGWIGAVTGDQAVWGTAEKQTLEMLIEQTNADGGILGKQVELVAYDTRGDVTEAVNATKRLTTQDNVIGIIGPNASDQAIAIAGTLEQAKVPDIATVATNPKVTVDDSGKVKDYNFRVCFIDPYQGAVAAGYAYEKLGFKSAAILYDVASDYSQGFTQYFEETFTKLGGTIVAKEGFKTGDVDFRPQLSKIKETNPEVILMPYFYKEVALTANQARDLGITAVLMGGDGWPSEQLMEMAQNAVQGSIIVNHLDYADPEAVPLKEAYEAKFGTPTELNTYMANDAFLLLKAAIEKAGEPNSVKVTQALNEVTVKGVTGNIKIDPETHNPDGKEAAIVKIEGDQYIFQEKYGIKVD
ncbi:ABC transporter substrate-binding protein [Filifactor villosus]|uniref:ABC transporter substrate-binding protein n=1 Tax=Filifactor villosus TaxID=29374 RepID=A0ABV9QJ05_9FIRM